MQFKAPRNSLPFSHTSLILPRQNRLHFQGQARAPSGHNLHLEENNRDTHFQKAAYRELSLDIKASSHDLAKTLPRALHYYYYYYYYYYIKIKQQNFDVEIYINTTRTRAICRITLGYIGSSLTMANKAPKLEVFYYIFNNHLN